MTRAADGSPLAGPVVQEEFYDDHGQVMRVKDYG